MRTKTDFSIRRDSCFYSKATIEDCPNGIKVTRPKYLGKKRYSHLFNHTWKRGKITTFSRASSAKMRNLLVTLPNASMGYFSWGVTLTLSSNLFNSKDDKVEYFRHFWRLFVHRIYRLAQKGNISNNLFFVWRVELQQNGTPHFHVLLYSDIYNDVLIFRDAYLKQLKKCYQDCGNCYTVDIKNIDSFQNAYKYIATHSSKHKKSQLGWQGRQWGIIFSCAESKKHLTNVLSYDNNNAVNDGECKLCTLSFKSYVGILRILRKLYNSKKLSFLKSHFLIADSRQKIMRYAME